jgi:hypothetical protein
MGIAHVGKAVYLPLAQEQQVLRHVVGTDGQSHASQGRLGNRV